MVVTYFKLSYTLTVNIQKVVGNILIVLKLLVIHIWHSHLYHSEPYFDVSSGAKRKLKLYPRVSSA